MDAKIPQTNETFRMPSIAKSFVYEPITCDEVVLEINQWNPNKLMDLKTYLINF